MTEPGNDGAPAAVPPELPGAPADPGASPILSGAGFWIRALARLIDLVYGTFIGLLVGIAAGILFAVLSHMGRLTPDWPQLIGQRSLTGFGLGILGAFLYQAVAEGVGSVSIGKLACGLRVAQVDGGPATLKAAFVRDLVYHIDALFFGAIGYLSMKDGPLQQRYGDIWAHTVVVKASVFEPRPARSPLRMTLGILLGTVLWAAMGFLQLVLKVT